VLFGGGARFDLAAPRSRLSVGGTRILLSRFHPGRGGATVLEVGVFASSAREKNADPATFCIPKLLSVSSLYVVKLKIAQNSRLLTAVRSVEPIVLSHKRSFLSLFVENSFSSLLTKNILHSHGFYHRFIFELNMVNFNM